MTVPTTLEGWIYDAVKELIDTHCHEDRFEWKQQLPTEDRGRRRLVDCAAAMGNADGGFIIFGVKDDAQLPSAARIVGIDPTLDFPKRFSDQLTECDPAPAYRVHQQVRRGREVCAGSPNRHSHDRAPAR